MYSVSPRFVVRLLFKILKKTVSRQLSLPGSNLVQYWKFENMVPSSGYPKALSKEMMVFKAKLGEGRDI